MKLSRAEAWAVAPLSSSFDYAERVTVDWFLLPMCWKRMPWDLLPVHENHEAQNYRPCPGSLPGHYAGGAIGRIYICSCDCHEDSGATSRSGWPDTVGASLSTQRRVRGAPTNAAKLGAGGPPSIRSIHPTPLQRLRSMHESPTMPPNTGGQQMSTRIFYTARGQTYHVSKACGRLGRSSTLHQSSKDLPKRKSSKLQFTTGRGKSARDLTLRRCTVCG